MLGTLQDAIIAAVVSFLLGLGGGVYLCHKEHKAQQAQGLIKQAKQEQQILQQHAAIVAKHDQAGAVNTEKVRTVYKTIYKKVPVYVTKIDDSKCRINNGFVSVWNNASAMQDFTTNSPGVSDAAASDIKLSQVEDQHIKDAEQYNALRLQVLEWQKFYMDLKNEYDR